MPRAYKLTGIFFIVLAAFAAQGCSSSSSVSKIGNTVQVLKQGQDFQLYVNGEPFYIKGVGVGEAFGKKGENYLKMAKEMGANAVRTWGTEQGTQKYLDEAARQGLLVDAGIWLNPVGDDGRFSYIHDSQYLVAKEKETLDYVQRFKGHPAVLMWNIGNEAISFTKNEEERVALSRFLALLIDKVKAIDPNHPVIYASANTVALPYLKQNVTNLDAVGMNVYGSVISAEARWTALAFEIPYLITEFGPQGPWDQPKDVHGKVAEPLDQAKASQYRNHWKLITERRGKNIGGFAFHLGETSQESLTYWNLNDHLYKKESFLVMQKFYGAGNLANHAPYVDSFEGVPKEISAGGSFGVEVKAHDVEGDALSYFYTASSSTEGVLGYYVNTEVPLRVEGEGAKATVSAPKEKGLYRVYAFVRDDQGNSSAASRILEVV